MTWDGEAYEARFAALAAEGKDLHGEARFVEELCTRSLAHPPPFSVLDAGCGTGRVARELARRGWMVVGVDAQDSMLATARRLARDLEWITADLTLLDLGRRFDVVVLAGNVPLFISPGTLPGLVAACARHLDAGGFLVTGCQLGREFILSEYDSLCSAADLSLAERCSTWERAPFTPTADYAVSVHRRVTG